VGKGYRKMALAVVFGAGIAFIPDLSATQAEVLEVLIVSVFAANGVEHVAQGVKSGFDNRNRVRTAGSVRPVTVQEPQSDQGAH
jgi:hypothetical protein